MQHESHDARAIPPRRVTLAEANRVWAKIGCLSFGGPAGQIALMHRELVEQRRWISEERFLHALNYCMLLPGPEAAQLAIYIGWLMHRTVGGLIAGLWFVVPGALVMLGLSIVYAAFGQTPWVEAIFFGLKAAVLAVVLEAVLRIARRALKDGFAIGVAIAAFLGIHLLGVPFPLIVAAAAVSGILAQRWKGMKPTVATSIPMVPTRGFIVDELIDEGGMIHIVPSWSRALRTLAIGLALWATPVIVAVATLGPDSVLARQGVLFSEAAVVTFGGAYAVLAYIAQRVVIGYGWLSPSQMVDGLALAETTPGPLIIVLQFVAFMAAFQHPEGMSPWTAGILGSLLSSWVTFVPCFIWIFMGGPYIEALRSNRVLQAALNAVTAAVVGVILNLSVWFAEHTLFGTVSKVRAGWVHMDIPVIATVNPAAAVLTLGAILAMFRFRLGMAWTLLLCAVAGVAWRLGFG